MRQISLSSRNYGQILLPFSLPEWAPEDIFEPRSDMENMANYVLKLGTSSPELARLSSGFLIRDMLDRFNESQQHPETGRSILLYAGHDSTIANLLNSLGLFEVNSKIHLSLIQKYFRQNVFFVCSHVGPNTERVFILKCTRRQKERHIYKLPTVMEKETSL